MLYVIWLTIVLFNIFDTAYTIKPAYSNPTFNGVQTVNSTQKNNQCTSVYERFHFPVDLKAHQSN